jgi:hypothetical protein
MSRCQACGRLLRRPSLSGLGPVCFRRLNPPPPRTPRPSRLPAVGEVLPEIHPGQTALPLAIHQPSLWSL